MTHIKLNSKLYLTSNIRFYILICQVMVTDMSINNTATSQILSCIYEGRLYLLTSFRLYSTYEKLHMKEILTVAG